MLGHAEQSDLSGVDPSLCGRVEDQEPQLPVVTDPVSDSALTYSAPESSAFVEKAETFDLALHLHGAIRLRWTAHRLRYHRIAWSAVWWSTRKYRAMALAGLSQGPALPQRLPASPSGPERLSRRATAAPPPRAQSASTPLAVCGGVAGTEAVVRAVAREQLAALEVKRPHFETTACSEEHAGSQPALDELIADRLLRAEAARWGVSVAAPARQRARPEKASRPRR